jgi:hypothetical protein
MVKTIGCSSKRLGNTNKRLGYTNVPRQNKENSHRYKQKLEKAYVLHKMIESQKQIKEKSNEKIQEVH